MYADHRISPFEGGRGDVLFEGTEYLHFRDVNNQIRKSNKKIPISQKKRLPFFGAVSIVKKYRRIDNLKLLR